MILKSGRRCSFKAKHKGLCGHHSRIEAEATFVKTLITAGKLAAAVAALIKLIEELVDVFRVFHYYYQPSEAEIVDDWNRATLDSTKDCLTKMQSLGTYDDLQRVADHVIETANELMIPN
jgi:hypothetical protein